MRLGIARLERQSARIAALGLGQPILVFEDIAEIVVSLGKAGIAIDGRPIGRLRLDKPLLPRQHVGDVVMRNRRTRLDRAHPLVATDRLIGEILLHQRVAEVHMRRRIVRLQRNRPPVVLDRLAGAAAALQRAGEIVVGIRQPAVEDDRPPNELDRELVAIGLNGQDTEIVQTFDVVRVGREHAAIVRFGLRQRARPMKPHGDGEGCGGLATDRASGGSVLGSTHRSHIAFGFRVRAPPAADIRPFIISWVSSRAEILAFFRPASCA